MIAELLGSALSAFARALIASTYDRSSPWRVGPAALRSLSHESLGPIARCGQRGFILTELMVSDAIVGVLGTTGAPPLRSMIVTQWIKPATVDLSAALTNARSVANKRNSLVTITPRKHKPWHAQCESTHNA